MISIAHHCTDNINNQNKVKSEETSSMNIFEFVEKTQTKVPKMTFNSNKSNVNLIDNGGIGNSNF